jgi:peptidyl-prolyl cis-trans isomerase D
MAAISKIREKSGLLVVVIGVALGAFVLTDLLGSLGKGGSSTDRFTTAYVNDEQIRTEYFQQRLDQAYQNMEDQGQEVTSEMRFDLMNTMWDQVKKETIIRQECEKIGLAQDNGNDIHPSISMAEFMELVNGDNLHPAVKQSFPQPGQYEQMLNNIEQGKQSTDAAQKEEAYKYDRMLKGLEQYVKTEQLKEKYNTLIEKSFYLPKALAKELNDLRTSSFSVKYYAIRYNSQGMNSEDETIVPTEADYEAYYEEHKNEFEITEAKRKIDYVVWNVFPSDEDMREIETKVAQLYQEFKDQPANELNYFVNRNRGMHSAPFDSLWKKPSQLSPQIDSAALTAEDGFVFPPIRENNAFKIVRIMEHDERPDSLRASHILIGYAGSLPNNDSLTRLKPESEVYADSILNILKSNPERFEELATTLSDDSQTAEKQGDLDWFEDGKMIPQFNEACVNGNIGDIVKVETQYGYHILKVTGKTQLHQKVRVAEVSVDIKFSKKTKDQIYMAANRFAAMNKDSAAFYAAVEEQGLSVMEAELTNMTKQIPSIQESRNIVKWAFGIDGIENEGVEVYTVSDVFDYPSQIVVAIVTEVNEPGIAPLADVKADIKKLVQRDVEAKKIIAEVGENPDFYALAKERNIAIDSMEYYSFGYGSLKGYGPEPYVLGNMQVAEAGKTYGPIKGTQGVFFFVVSNRADAMEVQDNYMSIRMQEYQTFSRRVQGNQYGGDNDIYKALKKTAEVEDYRYNFW